MLEHYNLIISIICTQASNINLNSNNNNNKPYAQRLAFIHTAPYKNTQITFYARQSINSSDKLQFYIKRVITAPRHFGNISPAPT